MEFAVRKQELKDGVVSDLLRTHVWLVADFLEVPDGELHIMYEDVSGESRLTAFWGHSPDYAEPDAYHGHGLNQQAASEGLHRTWNNGPSARGLSQPLYINPELLEKKDTAIQVPLGQDVAGVGSADGSQVATGTL